MGCDVRRICSSIGLSDRRWPAPDIHIVRMPEFRDHAEATFWLLRSYLRGEAPLDEIVAAIRLLPPLPPDDVWFGLEESEMTPDAHRRLEVLDRALAEAERAD